MFFFPLQQIPGLVWPAVAPGAASQLWAIYLGLDRSQWLPAAELVEGQLAQVRALLAHCSQHVPYYRDLLRTARIKPAEIRSMDDFRRIPILQRSTYQEQFSRFQARQLPSGITKTNEGHSSGTSGLTIEIWQTNLVDLWWLACFLRDLQWADIDPRGSLAPIRVMSALIGTQADPRNGVVFPEWSPELAPLLKTGLLYAMDSRADMDRQLQWLLDVRPNYLLCSVAIASFLASLLLDQGRRVPNLRAVQVLGETLTQEAQARIEEGFGVPVKNLYSCTEAGYLASVCPEGHGMHVHGENVLLEVLDDHDNPCRSGETGRVVLTTLRNHLTPFVRYEILDIASLGPAPCPCGRGLPLLTRVHGKCHPILQLPGGHFTSSRALIIALEKLALSRQHQVVQRARDHLVIRMVPNRNWNEGSQAQVAQCVLNTLGTPVRVDVEIRDRIEITTGGKVRDVVIAC